MQAIFARTALGCALIAALLSAAPAPGQGEHGSATGVLRPFEAVYQVVQDKRQAKMSVSLRRVAEDVYAHDMKLSLFIIGTVRQTLMMRRTGDDLRPLYAAGASANGWRAWTGTKAGQYSPTEKAWSRR